VTAFQAIYSRHTPGPLFTAGAAGRLVGHRRKWTAAERLRLRGCLASGSLFSDPSVPPAAGGVRIRPASAAPRGPVPCSLPALHRQRVLPFQPPSCWMLARLRADDTQSEVGSVVWDGRGPVFEVVAAVHSVSGRRWWV